MINSGVETNEAPSGFMKIDKPSGPTSHDMVYRLRRITGIKKIGHAGTLDPFASGLLIMAIGRTATRKIDEFVKLDKKYEAVLYLGANSTTHDPEGEKTIVDDERVPELTEIKRIVANFLGEQDQIPPMYSAKKINGQKLYELARKGKEVERLPVRINIFDIGVLEYKYPALKIFVHCSSGTFIRVIAHDIGAKLKTGAYLTKLKRTAIGRFSLDGASTIESMDKDNWPDQLIVEPSKHI